MIVKTKVLHTEFSFEKNKYTNKPSMFSIFVFSHKKILEAFWLKLKIINLFYPKKSIKTKVF